MRGHSHAILGAFLLAVAAVSGCAGTTPTEGQVAEERQAGRVDQILRVAESTRAGGDLVSAAGLFQRAREMAPDRTAPLLGLGETLLMMDADEEAAQTFAKAIELEPGSAPAHFGYGRALFVQGRLSDAAGEFRTAISGDSSNPRFFNGLGMVLDTLGEHPEAQQAYIEGLTVAPDHRGLRNNLGFSMLLEGAFDEAVRQFEDLVENPLSSVRHRQNLALAYGLAGREDQAAQIARHDLAEDEVRHNLAVYRRLRDMSDSERRKALLGIRDGSDL